MKLVFAMGTLALLSGCSSDGMPGKPSSDGGDVFSSGGNAATGGSSANGGSSASGGNTATGGSSANGASGGSSGAAGSGPWSAGSVTRTCTAGLPAETQAVDTSGTTNVVGTGTPDGCTFAALSAAIAKGGPVAFKCGGAAVTIPITATLTVPTDKDTVVDGGRLITLDGQNKVQILSFNSPGWQTNEHRLTLEHLRVINAKTTPTDAIPKAPAPCSQGFDDGQGGGVYMRDGNLTVIDSIFTSNHAAPLGPDTGGGAIYVQGSKHGIVIAKSTFEQNDAANAGAVGGLFTELHVYESLFTQNSAIGNGANNNDAKQCSVMNNGQNEIGSGGNGGSIYSDGNSVNILLCGDEITDNKAGTGGFGGGLFFTSNNMAGTLSITDTTMTGNSGGHWTNVSTGSVTDVGSAVGTNCKSITVQNSTLQDYP